MPKLPTGHPKAFVLFLLLVAQSCATYYQAHYGFNQSFEQGRLEQALEALKNPPSRDYRKNAFLYLANSGLLLSILGRYEESNEFLEKAYLFGEDYQKNYLTEAASYLSNPMVATYKGEDHEHLMVLYYKAMNYLKMGMHQEALVECRRLNIRLQQLSDRYGSEKKYRKDAFSHLLMGIIYESDNDYNNAFIAYRNAYETYQNEYTDLFGMTAPPQLKDDLLRTSLLSGLAQEHEAYKKEFHQPGYEYRPEEGGELVFFWHNGLSPVKTEWSINFVVHRKGDQVTFVSDEYNFSFPFDISGYDEKDKKGLGDLEIFRVAFPKYVERPEYFTEGSISNEGEVVSLEPVEDINKIATQVLRQRMALEFSKALLRAAMKKVAEYEMRKENKALGSLFGIINAVTEKADTRNWQTLPHSIYYARVPLHLGTNDVALDLRPGDGSPTAEYHFTYEVGEKGTLFHTFTSLEGKPPRHGFY